MKMKTNKMIFSAFLIFAIVGLIFVIAGTLLCVKAFDYSNTGETTAIITEIETHTSIGANRKARTSHKTHLEYEIDGYTYTCVIGSYSSEWDVGDEIEIYYDLDDRYSVRAKDTAAGLIVLPCMGVVFFSVGVVGLLVTRKKQKSLH